MNHLTYFGFTDDPFRLTPDRDFFYPSVNHTALVEVVRFGLHQGEGFIIVNGEVGTGKTMMLRFLMNDLGDEFETALLLSPHLSPKELMLAILQDIGLEIKGQNGATSSMDSMLRILNDYLFSLAKVNQRLVIIIDEAQNLPEESIEQLRLLSNFESDKQKLLQIILVGQPELKEKIERPNLRQLLQRVTIMETLNPLSRKETAQYVHFRLTRAGRDDMRLNRRAGSTLWGLTQGVPRLINKIMSRALLVAYAEQKQEVDASLIRKAAASLELASTAGIAVNSRLALLATTAMVLVLLFFFFMARQVG
jgi:general secretion pathway protein A